VTTSITADLSPWAYRQAEEFLSGLDADWTRHILSVVARADMKPSLPANPTKPWYAPLPTSNCTRKPVTPFSRDCPHFIPMQPSLRPGNYLPPTRSCNASAASQLPSWPRSVALLKPPSTASYRTAVRR